MAVGWVGLLGLNGMIEDERSEVGGGLWRFVAVVGRGLSWVCGSVVFLSPWARLARQALGRA